MMRNTAFQRPARAAAIALIGAVGVCCIPAVGHAAAAPTVTCNGSTTFSVSTDASGEIGGTADLDYQCAGSGASSTLTGHSTLALAPEELARDTAPPAGLDEETITWSDGSTSVLQADSAQISEEADADHATVPILLEVGHITDGQFAGAHFARVITNPVWSEAVSKGEKVTSPVMLTITRD